MSSNNPVPNFYRVSANDFKKIPGSPIAYWVSPQFVNPFTKANIFIKDLTISDGQTKTGNNDKYLRQHWEIALDEIGPEKKWWQHPKGGPSRKWYGNVDWVIDWSNEARKHYRKDRVARILPEYLWGKSGISWTLITSGDISFRTLEPNQIFNLAAPSLFFKSEKNINICLGFLNTKYVSKILKIINPTLNMNVGEIRSLPIIDEIEIIRNEINNFVKKMIDLSKSDWNSYETSWDFTSLPLLCPDYREKTVQETYAKLRKHWKEMTFKMQKLEEENNRIFIEAYGLQDELTPEVPLKEITLTCNPYYRYGDDKSEEQLEAFLQRDTIKEFISYAVGCIFGRYSLDVDGLVLANAGDGLEQYLAKVPEPSFTPDESGILPITDEDDFTDDLPNQFRRFLRASFGEEHYQENLHYIEETIGKDIRGYVRKDFYADHVQRYKKRPIYWMISSPSGTLRALIYLHRYTRDTINRFLNDYLRPYQKKLTAKKDHLAVISDSSSAAKQEKTRALKRINEIEKQLKELSRWEHDVVYPLAMERIELDLDDGVKVNYGKLGAILEPVKGLNG